MCFSPQRRAIFRHLNRQKWSKHAVFCTFWLANVLFATAACNFWFLLWAPTSAPAALTGLLFDWPDTRIIEKTQHFATSLTFGADVSSFFWLSRYCIFCRLTWRLYCWAMHLLFNSPYCRKFLFKLPSIIYIRIHEPCDTVGPWQGVPAAQANKTTAIVAAAVAQRGSKWEESHRATQCFLHSFCHAPNVLDQLAVSRFRSTGPLTNFPRLPSRAQETEDYERALAAALATENRDEENVRAEESTRSNYVSNSINQFNNDSVIVCNTIILHVLHETLSIQVGGSKQSYRLSSASDPTAPCRTV